MLTIKERDPLDNLMLEVLEDPSKKEMIYYLLSYFQLVKREGSYSIELSKFLSYTYRSFQRARGYWKDLLVSMNLFSITDVYGNVYLGKDIYKVEEDGIYFISLKKEYLDRVDSINYKALKIWNILSRTGSYQKHPIARDAVILSALMFNEGLYQEAENYCELCLERYPHEYPYFRAIYLLSGLYSAKSKELFHELRQVIKDLEGIGGVYYGINILKLRRDIEILLKRAEKENYLIPIKIEFINQKGKDEGFWGKIIRRIGRFIKGLFGKRDKEKYFLEEYLCSKSSQTLYINS